MSMTVSGKGKCDTCGQLEESPSIMYFLIVADLDPSKGQVLQLLFCRRQGCAQKLVSTSPTLADIIGGTTT